MGGRMGTDGTGPTRFGEGDAPAKTPTPFEMTDGSGGTFASFSDAVTTGLAQGSVIGGQFEVVRVLGRGGMGVVYEVCDRLTKQHLALKVILPSILAREKSAERFVQEVNTARRLRHPGIVAVYDLRQDGPLLFFTMEYVNGITLREILNKRGKLPLAESVRILIVLCDALEEAHRYTVHRDLSPENVIVADDGRVKILDFGIAKAMEQQTLTATAQSMGKAYYIAPEQRRDASRVDARADLYSLGVMFFEMLTGEMPMGTTQVTQFEPELPSACDEVLQRTVCPLPIRYAQVSDLRQALRAFMLPVNGGPTVASPPLSATEPEHEPGTSQTFDGIEFVWIPPGTFTMGSPASEVGRLTCETQHEVTLSRGFWLGKYTVTQAQWKRVMASNPAKFQGVNLPVEQVSWDDAQAFIAKLNQGRRGPYRLPTEAEWEYACRAGTGTAFHYGNRLSTNQACFNKRYQRQPTTTVGSFTPNAWGLCDMHGNVSEWCNDWFGDSFQSTLVDPTGPSSGSGRVLRGGSWSFQALSCRTAFRDDRNPAIRDDDIGFRIARNA